MGRTGTHFYCSVVVSSLRLSDSGRAAASGRAPYSRDDVLPYALDAVVEHVIVLARRTFRRVTESDGDQQLPQLSADRHDHVIGGKSANSACRPADCSRLTKGLATSDRVNAESARTVGPRPRGHRASSGTLGC